MLLLLEKELRGDTGDPFPPNAIDLCSSVCLKGLLCYKKTRVVIMLVWQIGHGLLLLTQKFPHFVLSQHVRYERNVYLPVDWKDCYLLHALMLTMQRGLCQETAPWCCSLDETSLTDWTHTFWPTFCCIFLL